MKASGAPKLADVMRVIEDAVSAVTLAELPLLLGHLEKIKALGWGRMIAAPSNGYADMNLLTVPEVAKLLKVSEYKTYELVRQGAIKKISIGDSVRVKLSDLQAYLSRNVD